VPQKLEKLEMDPFMVRAPICLSEANHVCLQIKLGLLDVAEGLSFLHNTAQVVHRNLTPECIVITQQGTWKIAGFSFATRIREKDEQGILYDYKGRTSSSSFPPVPNLISLQKKNITRGSPTSCSLYWIIWRPRLLSSRATIPQAICFRWG